MFAHTMNTSQTEIELPDKKLMHIHPFGHVVTSQMPSGLCSGNRKKILHSGVFLTGSLHAAVLDFGDEPNELCLARFGKITSPGALGRH
jgi:hypothetical protein